MNPELMEQSLILALQGKGKVKARPFVGCIIEKDGKVVGAGYHGQSGGKHAEAIALEKAGKNARGADLYVTLEPCNHRGLTGACTEKIIKSGVKRVFIGTLDLNPKVKGNGAQKLKKTGIDVRVGVMEPYARGINDYFNKWIKTNEPFVVLKSALTRDGFISWGDGKQKKISCIEAGKYVQDYRAECDCILVGVGTVLKDNPKLTCRKKTSRNPVRVVLDTKLEIPLDAKMFSEKGKTIVFHARGADKKKKSKLEKKGIECTAVPMKSGGKKKELDLKKVLVNLGKKQYMSVLVEGGQGINTAFLKAGLVDKAVLIFSRKEVGFGLGFCDDSFTKNLKLKRGGIHKLGDDVLIEGYLK